MQSQRKRNDTDMDKTSRLFAIMDTLRRHRRPVTAATLAEEHGVSLRTLYRDIATLVALGAPVEGEAGVGYMLRPGFFLPPLMFTAEELEALVLGARWVEDQPDPTLSSAASNALGKIASATPDDLRLRLENTGLWPVRHTGTRRPLPLLETVRKAMREEKALQITYQDVNGQASDRIIWPVQIAYYDDRQLVAAWCTMRRGFRHFRVERMISANFSGERYGERRAALARQWYEHWIGEHSERDSTI